MLDRPSYNFYAATYGGTASEGDFDAALPHAVAAVTDMVYPNDATGHEAVIDCAICAAVDVDIAHGCSGGYAGAGGASLGSFRIDAGSGGDARAEWLGDVRQAVRPYLLGTGLLNQVIC